MAVRGMVYGAAFSVPLWLAVVWVAIYVPVMAIVFYGAAAVLFIAAVLVATHEPVK